MQPGKQYYADDGLQVLVWPLDIMNITQVSGPGSFSHCCGHPIDVVGTSARYPIYAPCDCHRIYSYNDSTQVYQSDEPVHFATGTDYVCFSFTHDNSPPSQSSFKQGDLIAHTGTAGQVTGDHSHIDQSIGQNHGLVSYGITCAFGNQCWALSDSTDATNVWYVNDTNIVNSMGLNFKTFDGTVSTLEWIIPTDIGSSRPLTMEEMQNNAKCFYGEMNIRYGMSLNAVCGILGNAQSESTINPARWQGDEPYHQPPDSWGYGLLQWTPYTKLLDWLPTVGYPLSDTSRFGEGECLRINWEKINNQQWISTSAYPLSFDEFWISTESPDYLALAFLANYERPFDPNQPIRGTQALEWYNYLKDWTPILPGTVIDPTKGKKKSKWIYYMKPRIPF